MSNSESKKQRRLTPAEEKRKAEFEELSAKLAAEGYEKADFTFGAVYTNIMALVVTVPIVVIFFILFILINPGVMLSFGVFSYLIVLLLFFALIVVHELIHGFFWSLFTKEGWKAISFGFNVQALAPYCTCKEPLGKPAYLAGACAPLILLGIIPAIIAMIIGNVSLFWLSILMIFGGGGDLLIILKLLFYRRKAEEILYLDHPYDIGTVLFYR